MILMPLYAAMNRVLGKKIFKHIYIGMRFAGQHPPP